MITWEEAQTKIRDVASQHKGQNVPQLWLDGVTVMSSAFSNFGYHFAASANLTDHNWSGEGYASNGDPCYQGTAQVGQTILGKPFCFRPYASDEAGIGDLVDVVHPNANPDVAMALDKGDVVTLAYAIWKQDGVPADAWVSYYEKLHGQFDSEESLRDALIADFQDLEKKTGRTTGWTVYDKPVGQYNASQTTKSGVGSGSDAGSGSGTSGLLVGGAIAAVAIGLLYAATKVKLRS